MIHLDWSPLIVLSITALVGELASMVTDGFWRKMAVMLAFWSAMGVAVMVCFVLLLKWMGLV